MAIQVDQPFELKNKEALDVRTHFKTIQEMKDYNEAFLPETFYAVNDETGKIYVFNKKNVEDTTLGKWVEAGGSNANVLKVEEFNTFWDALEITSVNFIEEPTP